MRITVVVLAFLLPLLLTSQCPPTSSNYSLDGNGYTLSCLCRYTHFPNQASIDLFTANYPNCDSLDYVVIGDFNNLSDITNLDGLGSLAYLGISINIFNTQLINLDGVLINNSEQLLRIAKNPALISLQGLTTGDSIRNLVIYENDRLNNIQNLNLKYIEHLAVGFNDSLENVQGLEQLQNAGNISIRSNSSLNNVNHLNNLRSCERLDFTNNPKLVNVSGLSMLDSIFGGFTISRCLDLISLDGLQPVFIFGDLRIQNNNDLVDISSLNSLQEIGGIVSITHNEILEACNTTFVCNYLSDGRYAEIFGNLGDCATEMDVLVACGIDVVCPYNVTFNNQQAIDSFSIYYPDCKKINGSLSVNGSNIVDLKPIKQIESVGNQLIIENNNLLKSLKGLDSIGFVGERIQIKYNPMLSTLYGMDQAYGMRGIIITDNDMLEICNTNSICKWYNNRPYNGYDLINNNLDRCERSKVKIDCTCLSSQNIMLDPDGIFRAEETITINVVEQLNTFGWYSAPSVSINPSFESSPGVVLIIDPEGCSN